MTEYRRDYEPRETHWTNRLDAIDTARAILSSQHVPSDLREYPGCIQISADPRCENTAGSSVFILTGDIS